MTEFKCLVCLWLTTERSLGCSGSRSAACGTLTRKLLVCVTSNLLRWWYAHQDCSTPLTKHFLCRTLGPFGWKTLQAIHLCQGNSWPPLLNNSCLQGINVLLVWELSPICNGSIPPAVRVVGLHEYVWAIKHLVVEPWPHTFLSLAREHSKLEAKVFKTEYTW